LQLLFYLTPIFYETSSVPESLRWFYKINPLAHLVDAYRAVLMRGELPAANSVLYLTVVSLVLLFAGVTWFKRASFRFADEL
jgi:lipopolysaccharide transport system permease protein